MHYGVFIPLLPFNKPLCNWFIISFHIIWTKAALRIAAGNAWYIHLQTVVFIFQHCQKNSSKEIISLKSSCFGHLSLEAFHTMNKHYRLLSISRSIAHLKSAGKMIECYLSRTLHAINSTFADCWENWWKG